MSLLANQHAINHIACRLDVPRHCYFVWEVEAARFTIANQMVDARGKTYTAKNYQHDSQQTWLTVNTHFARKPANKRNG
jgi:hypothetical protein